MILQARSSEIALTDSVSTFQDQPSIEVKDTCPGHSSSTPVALCLGGATDTTLPTPLLGQMKAVSSA